MSLLEEGLFFLKVSEWFKCKSTLLNALQPNYCTALLRTYPHLILMVVCYCPLLSNLSFSL